MKLEEVKRGDTFKIGDIEFIKFDEENGIATAVTKKFVYSGVFGNNNDFSKSRIIKKLEKEFLTKISKIIGDENIIEFKTDLTTIDGLKKNGKMRSKVSLPTIDFYRSNREIFDNYKVNDWWWLATGNGEYYVFCVAPSGRLNNRCSYYDRSGVRPILYFVSSISVS